MESKYYHPTIEEFCIGFEYERNDGGDWYKKTSDVYDMMDVRTLLNKTLLTDGLVMLYFLQKHPSEFEDAVKKTTSPRIRVKELDSEDLQELGWEPKGSGWYNLKNVSGELGYWTHVMFHQWGDDSPIIAYRGEPQTALEEQHLFVGNIRNKSEMKKLMKQLHLI